MAVGNPKPRGFRYNEISICFLAQRRRGGRVAEGGGLLNRYTVKSCIGGSNPPLSARISLPVNHDPFFSLHPVTHSLELEARSCLLGYIAILRGADVPNCPLWPDPGQQSPGS